jgi:hypothetical protein
MLNPLQMMPTERLVTFALQAQPDQTAQQIFKAIGGKTYSHLKVALPSLTLAGIITSTLSEAGILTYSLAATQAVGT